MTDLSRLVFKLLCACQRDMSTSFCNISESSARYHLAAGRNILATRICSGFNEQSSFIIKNGSLLFGGKQILIKNVAS